MSLTDVMKYLVMDVNGVEKPYIFSGLDTHQEISFLLRGKVVSAGFADILDGKFVCYGKSYSLEVESRRGKDSKLLNRLFGNY